VVVRVDARLRIDFVKTLAKGIRCSKYGSVTKMLKVVRSTKIAQELAEDLDADPGPVYLIHYRNVRIITLPDHVHVISEEQLSEEEARKIVEELAELLEK